MRPALFLAASLISSVAAGEAPDPIAIAIQHYAQIETYSVTLQSVQQDQEQGQAQRIRYYFKKPGFVRMEFIQPHAGAVLVFSPLIQRVRLWPWGEAHFPELNLNPANPLILSATGQRVDHSDVGTLFEHVRALGEGGSTVAEDVLEGASPLTHLTVTGPSGGTVGRVHSFDLWINVDTQFPTKIISRDLHGTMLETVILDTLALNPPLPAALFEP